MVWFSALLHSCPIPAAGVVSPLARAQPANELSSLGVTNIIGAPGISPAKHRHEQSSGQFIHATRD
jgi:hypothetical protein